MNLRAFGVNPCASRAAIADQLQRPIISGASMTDLICEHHHQLIATLAAERPRIIGSSHNADSEDLSAAAEHVREVLKAVRVYLGCHADYVCYRCSAVDRVAQVKTIESGCADLSGDLAGRYETAAETVREYEAEAAE